MWCSSHTCSQQKTMIGSSWPEVLTKQSVCLQRAFLTLTTLSESFQGAAQAAQGFSSQLATQNTTWTAPLKVSPVTWSSNKQRWPVHNVVKAGEHQAQYSLPDSKVLIPSSSSTSLRSKHWADA